MSSPASLTFFNDEFFSLSGATLSIRVLVKALEHNPDAVALLGFFSSFSSACMVVSSHMFQTGIQNALVTSTHKVTVRQNFMDSKKKGQRERRSF